MIRISGGFLKGRLIKEVPDKRTRYTSSVVRQALFNMVDVEGKSFLDLFCGSCLVMIEALSRGASEVFGVDISGKAISACKKNLSDLRISDRAVLYKGNAVNFVKSSGRSFDVIFMDPPYGLNLANKVLASMRRDILEGNGILVVEEKKNSDLIIPDFLEIISEKKYGDTKLVVMRKR